MTMVVHVAWCDTGPKRCAGGGGQAAGLPRLWPATGVQPRAANPGDGTELGLWPRLWHSTGVSPGGNHAVD